MRLLRAAISVAAVIGVTWLWGASYADSLWWPVSLQTVGVQLHAWRGRVFLVWDFDKQRPRPPMFFETLVVDGPWRDPHPNPGLERQLDAAVRRSGGFTSKQVAFGVAPSGPSNAFGFRICLWRWSLGAIAIPAWFLLAAAVGGPIVIPAVLKARRERRRRDYASKRLCVRCGYDLRASPQQCPECGQRTEVGPDET